MPKTGSHPLVLTTEPPVLAVCPEDGVVGATVGPAVPLEVDVGPGVPVGWDVAVVGYGLVGGGASEMVIVRVCCGSQAIFQTDTSNVYLPALVGVPEMTPVPGSSVRPGGSAPEFATRDQVMGLVPSALSNAEYERPTTPSGRVVVRLVGIS